MSKKGDNKLDNSNKRQEIKGMLLKNDIIHDKFTGKVVIILSQGGIRALEKTESLL